MTKQVFISFSRKDDEIARALAAAIRATGFDAFCSADALHGVRGGAPWFQELCRGMQRSACFIFVCTPYAIAEPWPLFEMGAAIGRKKPAVILRVRVPVEKLPAPLQQIQAIDIKLPDADLQRALTRWLDPSDEALRASANAFESFFKTARHVGFGRGFFEPNLDDE